MLKKYDVAKLKKAGYRFAVSVIALFLSILVGGIIVAALGNNPVVVYTSLIEGAFGSPLALTGTINRMIPIIFAGLAIALGNKCSVFNIGVEGQILVGSFAAVWVGNLLSMPKLLHLPFSILIGILFGVLWAVLPAVLNLKYNVSVIFSTIMLNYIAKYLVLYLIIGFPGYIPNLGATPRVQETATLPNLFPVPFAINSGILIAIVTVVLVYIFIFKTRTGYEMRAVGLNRHAAHSAGIHVKKNMFAALLISAALAGLAGATDACGLSLRVVENANPGYLATGIAVAMLGQGNPFAIVVASFLFAGMKNGASLMQMKTGVSAQFVFIVQGFIIIFICSENLISWLYQKVKARREGSVHA